MISTHKIKDTATLYLTINQCVYYGGIGFAHVRQFRETDENGNDSLCYELIDVVEDYKPNPDFEEYDQARFDTVALYNLKPDEHLIEYIKLTNPDEIPSPRWSLIRSYKEQGNSVHYDKDGNAFYCAFNPLGL